MHVHKTDLVLLDNASITIERTGKNDFLLISKDIPMDMSRFPLRKGDTITIVFPSVIITKPHEDK